jgi:hypothetical protein
VVITRRLVTAHQVESALFFQSIVDKCPGTVLVFIDFALAIIGATAGSIDQSFVTGSDGTDTGRFSEQALTTLGAGFPEVTGSLFYGNKKRVNSRYYRFIDIETHPVNTQGTAHGQDTVGGADKRFVLFHGFGGHIVTGGGDNRGTRDAFTHFLELCFHFLNLVDATGLGQGSAGAAANDKYPVEVLQHFLDFFYRFPACYGFHGQSLSLYGKYLSL